MIISQDREIKALVHDIKEGKLLLPELQRGYVWKSPPLKISGLAKILLRLAISVH